MLRHPDAIDHLGDGCLLEFLHEAGRKSALMACGACAIYGFNSDDGITNTVSGTCREELHSADEMSTRGTGHLEEVIY